MAHIKYEQRPAPASAGKLAPLTSQVLPPELAPAIPDDFPLPDMPIRVKKPTPPVRSRKRASRRALGLETVSMRRFEMPAERVMTLLTQ